MIEIYKKTWISSFIIGIGIAVFCIMYYFIGYKSFKENGDVLVINGLIALFSIGAGFRYKSVHKKLVNETVDISASTLNFENLNELILKRVPSPLLKIYNVDSNGNSLFVIEPSKGRLSRWLTFFELFEKGFIIPVHYDISDMTGQQLATITIRNNIKRDELIVKKPDGTVVATYVQQLLKSKLKNRGVLYHSDGSVWRNFEAKSIAGDIDVKDEEGHMTARYRFGIFPYAMRPVFQSTAHHEHVQFGSHITSDEKLAYTMIFFFWLKG
ncbi:hypothetical protein [Sporosarcina sp. JAI121]|uniref:hypothetical protein n=1 Tax=Sporosarcina sp. JAI121 TaxID=2723064 RepID=UPI0015CB92FE|nr:hypothetical protein [Sporosarcina sp. JAI121]NYF25834.1 hypothetical protein [Sporosarcina sp. JAI121]